MKKIIAIVLLAAMALGLAACGTINKADVAVLWSGADKAQIPNSLINAMDRAMYIENIAYTYYGAEGDAAKQLTQAQEALDAGCSALMVELVDTTAAQQIVDLAKAKDVPVIFFGCDVDKAITESYGKCVVVSTDEQTRLTKYTEMVEECLTDKKAIEKLDRDQNKKITILNCLEEQITLELPKGSVDVEFVEEGSVGDITSVEMILTDDDTAAQAYLLSLQEKDFNTNKLTTQYVAIFTVGNEFDYKAYVLEGAPEDKEALKAHYEASKYLVDLTTVAEEDLPAMIYTTANVIDSGRITGTVMEDYDAIAEMAAEVCAALITGKDTGNPIRNIPYTVYAG